VQRLLLENQQEKYKYRIMLGQHEELKQEFQLQEDQMIDQHINDEARIEEERKQRNQEVRQLNGLIRNLTAQNAAQERRQAAYSQPN
jgi:hypothetical protein